ncbi:queuine tRNA-ribosyltransferase accessory subunit 2 isoform X2 [Kryptolebias marmoratus]|nr:queuine tRNA-ribosyltransferase accessory subunit 2 isoform X2 [Kryptolebias marmoratus]
MALQKTVQPDWYQSMADGETWQAGASRKRVRKSVDRTLAHLDECLLLHQKSQELDGTAVFGVVEGGDVLEERVRSARETAKRPVAGFCLDGFQTDAMDGDLRTQLVTAVTEELPEDKPRLLQGVGRPDEVLACVEAGVDLFEGFFPFQVTERGGALCFRFDIHSDLERAGEEVQPNGGPGCDDRTQATHFEVNLKDKRFQDDFRPLVEGCGCYCCQNHQRAYVHHLLATNELLAGVLLAIHNTSHYQGFFRALRDALAQDKLDLLKKRLQMGGEEN